MAQHSEEGKDMRLIYSAELLMERIEESIEYSKKNDLPLAGIELTPQEWAMFRITLAKKYNTFLPFGETSSSYKGIKIYQRKP